MTRLVLIPCGKTFWAEEGRLAGAVDLPLSEQGVRDVEAVAAKLAQSDRLAVIYAGTGQATQETLQVLAKALAVKVKTMQGLEEPDMGLWEGLTHEQLRQRFYKAYKQLTEQPLSVRPPMGEPMDEAAARLIGCIEKICKKHPDETVGLVIGPLAALLIERWARGEQFQQRQASGNAPAIVKVADEGFAVRGLSQAKSKG